MQIKDNRTAVVAWHPGVLHCHDIVQEAFRKFIGVPPIISGAQEVGHSTGSRHYGIPGDFRCRAADYDSPHLKMSNYAPLVIKLRKMLGEAFDVLPAFKIDGKITYNEVKTIEAERLGKSVIISHLHIELDPKWT